MAVQAKFLMSSPTVVLRLVEEYGDGRRSFNTNQLGTPEGRKTIAWRAFFSGHEWLGPTTLLLINTRLLVDKHQSLLKVGTEKVRMQFSSLRKTVNPAPLNSHAMAVCTVFLRSRSPCDEGCSPCVSWKHRGNPTETKLPRLPLTKFEIRPLPRSAFIGSSARPLPISHRLWMHPTIRLNRLSAPKQYPVSLTRLTFAVNHQLPFTGRLFLSLKSAWEVGYSEFYFQPVRIISPISYLLSVFLA